MPSSMPLVTIIIPTYNQQAFIGCAIRSALAQDYPNIEIVVADDGSSDSTAQVVSNFLSDRRLRYIVHDANLGRVGNYRYCLRHLARGDWVLVLDGDDYLVCDTYIQRAVGLATSQPDIVLAFAKMKKTGTRGNDEILNKYWPYANVIAGDDFFLRHPPFVANGTLVPYHLTALYHRETALALDFYRSDTLSSDFELLYRLMIGHRIAFVDVVAGVWRQHDGNATWRPSQVEIGRNLDAYRGIFEFAKSTSLAAKMDLRRWHRGQLARAFFDGFLTYAIRERSPAVFLALLVNILQRDVFFVTELPRTLLMAMATRRRLAPGRKKT